MSDAYDPQDSVDVETPPRRRSSALPWAVLSAVGLVGGVAALGLIVALAPGQPSSPVEPPIAEPMVLMEPAETRPAGAELLAAQANVERLEQELLVQQAELAAVASAAGVSEDRLADTDLSLEVANLRANLEAARKVRDRLKGELSDALAQVQQSQAQLQQSQEELGVQRAETAMARTAEREWRGRATRNLWSAFAADTQLEVCERGTRKGLDRCQQEVAAWFTDARYDQFSSCTAGTWSPMLLTTEPDSPVPSAAVPLTGDDLPRRKAYHVVFCDPSLPEAATATAPAEPPAGTVAILQ